MHKIESMQENEQEISAVLKPLQDELINIKRQLTLLTQKPGGYTADEVSELQEKIQELENSKKTLYDSKPIGIAVIEALFEQVSEEAQDLKALTDMVSECLVPIVERLKQIKGQLGRLALTHKWTLKETDLRAYQLQLEEIENLKQDGIFKDPASDTIPEGQALINFLLRSCRRIMERMSSEGVPVSEALMPVYNQLSTVKRCLLEVSKWGKPDSIRDLYPYQMKLASIDNMRVNGSFCDEEGNIPEGQAICIALLNECYDILHNLMSLVEADT